jgi:uncharacterized protein (TIGR02145 family)
MRIKMINVLKLSILCIVFGLLFFSFSCSKDDYSSINGNISRETISDIDSNLYYTVAVGSQVWLKGNLRTTRYNNGTPIPNVTESTKWANLTTGAYRWYNDDPSNKYSYGALYNWHAVNSGKLCPVGWHVPTNTDWQILFNFLGGEKKAGDKLKEPGTSYWTYPNEGATNSSGFSARAGGMYSKDFSFGDNGVGGYWWSSTEYNKTNANLVYLFFTDSNVNRFNISKGYGISVRCVKDDL